MIEVEHIEKEKFCKYLNKNNKVWEENLILSGKNPERICLGYRCFDGLTTCNAYDCENFHDHIGVGIRYLV